VILPKTQYGSIAMTHKQVFNGLAAIAAFVLVIGALIEAWTIVK
jgi:hypothetical protein